MGAGTGRGTLYSPIHLSQERLWQRRALPPHVGSCRSSPFKPKDQVPPGPSRDFSGIYVYFLYIICHFCVAADSFSEQLFCKRSCSLKSGLETTNRGCAPSHSQENKQRGPFCCATFNKHAALFRAFKRKQHSSSCHPVKNVRLQSRLVLHMIGSILLNCCK